jgi:hypothetical protein
MCFPDPSLDFLPIPDPGSRGQKGTGSRIRIRNTDKKEGKIRSNRPVGLPAATVAGGNVLDPAGVLHSGQDLFTRYTLLIRLLLYTATALVYRSSAYSVVDTACMIMDNPKTRLCKKNGSPRGGLCSGSVTFFYTDPDLWIRTLDYGSGPFSFGQWLSRYQQNYVLFFLSKFCH